MGLRAPVTITKHGRPPMTFVDAGYFERLEEIAAGNILAALPLKHISTAGMPDDVSALLPSQTTFEDKTASRKVSNCCYPLSRSRPNPQRIVSLTRSVVGEGKRVCVGCT